MLVNALKNCFKQSTDVNKDQCLLVIHEVARKVLEERQFSCINIIILLEHALELQQHILKAQYNAKTTAYLKNPVTWFLCN